MADTQIDSQISEKGSLGHPLAEAQKGANRAQSKVYAHVGHAFGTQAHMGGYLVRNIGLQRTKAKIVLVYDMMRLVQLIKRDAKAVNEV